VGYVLGVDVGTTFTAAAVWRGGRVEVVPLGNHAAAIPSLVFLRDDGGVLVGDVAERRGLGEPSRLAREFKRRLGDTAPIMLDRTPFSADRLLGLLLRAVVVDVVERQGGVADVVVVTHPANWGEYKLDLLRQAVVLAGVPGALLLSEPVAAALQFAAGARVEVGEVVAVYDLGGGTFDAAVLRKSVGGFEVLGRGHGIERLGGIDFDEAVLTHVRGVVGDVIGGLDAGDVGVRAAFARLRAECVLAKESLSADSDASVSVLLPNVQMQVRITRVEFEDMIRPILRETVECVRRAVDAAGVGLGEVKVVLLAGGSSRIPLVADMVRGELGRPVVSDVHPKHSVAMGAARYGAGVLAATATPATAPAPRPAPPAPVPAVAAAATPPAAPAVSKAIVAATAVAAPAPAAPAPAKPIQPPPSDSVPPGKPRSQWMLLLVVLLVAAAAVGALVLFTGGDNGTTTDTTAVANTGATNTGANTTAVADTAATATTGGNTLPADPAVAAAEELQNLLQQDLPTATALVGKFVPQLSAKIVGLVEEPITYGSVEILADHMVRRDAYGAILVDGGAFAFEFGGQPMTGWFLSIVPEAFATQEAAAKWCTDRGLASNECFGREFKPAV
jgi:molecular chaperone DnaK